LTTCQSTCWTVIRAAAGGSAADRDELGRRYLGVVRAYLGARRRGSPLCDDLDDATQEVFVECFRQGGALQAATAGRVPNFRAFLYGVVRNVARRFESRPIRAAAPLPEIESDDATQSHLFDRTWAKAIMAEAAESQRRRAAERGPEATRRVELLRLRFDENLAIRDIAARWGVEPAVLHHAYAQARQEFKESLLETIAYHQPGSAAELENEAASLLNALS